MVRVTRIFLQFLQIAEKDGGGLVALGRVGIGGAGEDFQPAGVVGGVGVGFFDGAEAGFIGGSAGADFGEQDAEAVDVAGEIRARQRPALVDVVS